MALRVSFEPSNGGEKMKNTAPRIGGHLCNFYCIGICYNY